MDRLERFLVRGWNVFLLVIPIWIIRILLRNFRETNGLLDDPKGFLFYGYLFLAGHLLGRCPGVWQRLMDLRWKSLAVAVLLFAALAPDGEFPFPLEHMAVWAFSWLVLMSALGFARHLVRRSTPRLEHMQGQAYPFYILHQTVILLVGFPLMKPAMNPWTRLGLVILFSFLATWGLCEAIARLSWLRPCFGMGPKKRMPAVPQSSLSQPAEA